MSMSRLVPNIQEREEPSNARNVFHHVFLLSSSYNDYSEWELRGGDEWRRSTSIAQVTTINSVLGLSSLEK